MDVSLSSNLSAVSAEMVFEGNEGGEATTQLLDLP